MIWKLCLAYHKDTPAIAYSKICINDLDYRIHNFFCWDMLKNFNNGWKCHMQELVAHDNLGNTLLNKMTTHIITLIFMKQKKYCSMSNQPYFIWACYLDLLWIHLFLFILFQISYDLMWIFKCCAIIKWTFAVRQ